MSGLSDAALRIILVNSKPPPRNQPFDWTPQRKAELRKLRDKHVPNAAIAEHFGVSMSSIKKQIRDRGLDLRRPSTAKPLHRERPMRGAVTVIGEVDHRPYAPRRPCRWPSGNPAREMYICCRPAQGLSCDADAA